MASESSPRSGGLHRRKRNAIDGGGPFRPHLSLEDMMQEPFRLTPEMEQEIDAEITALTTYGKEPHDPVGARPRSVSIRRRNGGLADSGSIAPGSQDDSQVPAIADDPI